MTKEKTAYEMDDYALGVRVRAEATILRAKWLNEVLPAAEAIASGKGGEIVLPDVNEFADQYIAEMQKQNQNVLPG